MVVGLRAIPLSFLLTTMYGIVPTADVKLCGMGFLVTVTNTIVHTSEAQAESAGLRETLGGQFTAPFPAGFNSS